MTTRRCVVVVELNRCDLCRERLEFGLSYILENKIAVSRDHKLQGIGQSFARLECRVILTDEVAIHIGPRT